jgi:hypothetical protein
MTFEEDIKLIVPRENESIYDCLIRIKNKNCLDKQKVKDALDKHREKAFITCDRTCFCWDIEALLTDEK